MADYENLLDSIDAVIKSNNRREITGQILQNTLHQMVGSLGENYQLAGFATPTLDPNSPDQNVFYITDEAGVYTNFDNITLGAGLSFLMWKNEEWTSKTLDIVTADWVDEHYVSKAFLRKVFQFFDEDGVEIFPNDTESVVDNIKAMCGLWTNEYLSALGLGEGSTIPTTLAALNDVTITNPQDGQALVYDAASLHWVNATIQSGVDMSVVWAALAAATNEQINISHLTTALNDYVTATSLATTLQSYVTTSALATELASYASQSWVETNYVSKAFFNSLFEAQDVNGNAITPNNSGQTTIDRLKILVGAYTEQYLSALGLSSGGGGGGSSTLAGLNDVTITNPQDGQALIYDAQSSHWVNGAAISMSAVWTALAAATSEQINSSHLTSALSGYVTTSALASELANYVTTSSLATTLADYVTASALATTLADYGSKTWVDNNYVSKAFFNRLFQAFAPLAEGQTEPTQVEPNDTTTTIDNIKAMFGLWTEQYLSALGLSAGGGGGYTLNEPLSSINSAALGTPSQANVAIVWDGTAWTYGTTMSSVSWNDITNKPTTLTGYGITDAASTSDLANYLPLSGGTMTGSILAGTNNAYNIGSSTAKFYYTYFHRIFGVQSIESSLDGTYRLTLPSKSGTIAVTSEIPTNNNQLTNGAGYITSSALSGYATESWVSTQLGSYLPLSGGTLTGDLEINKNLARLKIKDTTGSLYLGQWDGTNNRIENSGKKLLVTSYENDIDFGFGGHGGSLFIKYSNNYVGIGTSSPSYKLDVNGDVKASSFIKTNGTSSQFLKADGSVDSNSYVTSSGVTSVATGTGLTGGTITSTGTISIDSTYQTYISNGNTAYGWGNHANAGYALASSLSGYLALTGGTLTGTLTLNGTTTALNAANGCIYNVDQIKTNDLSNSWQEAFLFARSDSYWDSFRAADGVFYFGVANGYETCKISLSLSGDGSYLQLGNIRLVYDSANNALKVINADGSAANFYATGGVAALGAASGTENYATTTWVNNNFVNKAGDGMSGSLSLSSTEPLIFSSFGSGTYNRGYFYTLSTGYVFEIPRATDSSNGTRLPFSLTWRGGGNTPAIHVTSDNYVGIGTNAPNCQLYVKDKLRISDGSHSITLGQWDGVNNRIENDGRTLLITSYSSGIKFGINGGGNALQITTGEYVGIGTSPSYKLHVAGAVGATGFTNTSDIRTKIKLSDIDLSIDSIAKAPAFTFMWNDKNIDTDIHVGTSAQYWRGVLPNVVSEANDEIKTLSMQYGVAALVSSITIAKKVVNHEERIKELEKENEYLREEISRLKTA